MEERVFISVSKDNLSQLPKDSYEVLDKNSMISQVRPEEIAKLEKQVFESFLLSRMGKSLISIQKVEDLSRVFLSSVYEASGAANCALFLYDEKDQFFKCVIAIGLDPNIAGEVKFKKEEGLFWQILNSAEPFPIVDSFGNYRFESIVKAWGLERLDSQVWVPLIVKETLIGVLTLGKKKSGGTY